MATSYDAFISYKRNVDGAVAAALEGAVERFAKPWHVRRSLRLFRDQTSLAAAPLRPSIEAALQESRYLVLLATPAAATSAWVAREIDVWIQQQKPVEHIIIVQTGGADLHWNDEAGDFAWESVDALPPNLKGKFNSSPMRFDLRAPLAAGSALTRDPVFLDTVASIAATLLGKPKDELIGEDLRQHRRALRLAWTVAAALALLVIFAFATRYDAEQQANIALARALAAQARLEVEARQDERAALLARESYLVSERAYDSTLGRFVAQIFGRQRGDAVLGQVDAALRTALGAPQFGRVHNLHLGRILAVAFSPDGHTVAVASGAHGIWLIDPAKPATRRKLSQSEDVQAPFWMSIAFSPDSRSLAAANHRGPIHLWHVDDPNAPPDVLNGGPEQITSLVFTDEGRTLAVGGCAETGADGIRCNRGAIFLMDPAQADSPPTVLGGPVDTLSDMVYAPDRLLLAAAAQDGTIWFWELGTLSTAPQAQLGRKFAGLTGTSILSLALDAEGKVLAAGGSDGIIQRWNLDEPAASPPPLSAHVGGVTSMAFTPDGRSFVTASDSGAVRLWNLADAAAEPVGLGTHDRTVTSVSISPDGQSLISGAGDGILRIWDLGRPAGAPLTLDTGFLVASSADLRADGRLLAVAGCDRTGERVNCAEGAIELFALADPDWPNRLPVPATPPTRLANPGQVFYSVIFSPDGQSLAATQEGPDGEGTLQIWNLLPVATPSQAPVGEVFARGGLTFSPDGLRLITSARRIPGGPAEVWDVSQLASPTPLRGDVGVASSIAVSADGEMIAVGGTAPDAGGMDGMIELWQLDQSSDAPHVLFQGDVLAFGSSMVPGMAFSPNSEHLAAAFADGAVRIWNPGEPDAAPTELPIRADWSGPIRFSPDGGILATGGMDGATGTVRLWRVDATSPPTVLRDAESRIVSLAFNPDGTTLAGLDETGTVYLWIVSTQTLAEMVCEMVWRNLSQDEWALFIGTDPADKRTCPDLPAGEESLPAGVGVVLGPPNRGNATLPPPDQNLPLSSPTAGEQAVRS